MKTAALAMVAMMALSSYCAAGADAVQRLHVETFGAVGDGRNDDGPAIRRALEAAARSGRNTVIEFDRRTYRISPRYDRWCSIAIEDARNITLDGQGATLLFHPHNRCFLIYRSRGITLRNFIIDYDPLPFTQGDVVKIDLENKRLILRIHDGFPLPDYGVGRHGAFIEKDRHRYTYHWFYIGEVEPIRTGETEGGMEDAHTTANRLYAVSGSAEAGHVERALQTEVGQRFVFPVEYPLAEGVEDHRFVVGETEQDRGVYHTNPAASIQVRFSRHCLLENLTLHASPAMSFRLTGTRDVTLRNIALTYKPGSGRLMVGASDGMHCKNNKTGPLIEGCVFEGLLDDSINLSTMSEDVMEKISDTEFVTQYSDIAWYDSSLAEGDRLLVFDPVRAVFLGEVKAKEVEFLSSHRRRLTTDRPVPGVVDAATVGRERATRFFIRKERPAVVRNCVFRSQMKTASVVRTPVRYENNTIENTAYGVHATNSPRWGEGPLLYDQVYRGNTFRDCWIAAIQLGRLAVGDPGPPVGGPIRIERCSFTQGPGHGVDVYNLADISIRDCSFVMEPDADPELRVIALRDCGGVLIKGCEIRDPRTSIDGAIRIRRMTEAAVRVEDCRFQLAEGSRTVTPGE